MNSHIWLSFVPKSQKNKTRRVTYTDHNGRERKSISYQESFSAQREKICWLFKQLDKAPEGYKFAVKVEVHAKEKRVKVEIIPTPCMVGEIKGVSDPDGVLVTIMDCLKLSGRIEDDSVNHVRSLMVEVFA